MARLGKQAAGGAGFIANLLLQQDTGYFAPTAAAKPLLHLWSLGVEEQFYIVWPLLLALGWRFRHVSLIIIGIGLLSFAINVAAAYAHPTFDFYSPVTRFWELLCGGLLARYLPSQNLPVPPGVREGLSALGLVLIIGAGFLLHRGLPFPGAYALLPVAGAVLLIAAGRDSWVNRRLLAHRLAVGIGLISYPLYLWHWPLLSFGEILSGEPPTRWMRMGLVVAAFALAILTYVFIEKPLRGGGLGKTRIILFAATLGIVGMAGVYVYADGGIAGRLPDNLAAARLDSEDLISAWKNAVRSPACHLQEPDMVTRSPECLDKQKPLLMLWGDSHAASLYPGLQALQRAHVFGIAQYTQGGCPPLFDLPVLAFRKDCNEMNRQISGRSAALAARCHFAGCRLDACRLPNGDRGHDPAPVTQHCRDACRFATDAHFGYGACAALAVAPAVGLSARHVVPAPPATRSQRCASRPRHRAAGCRPAPRPGRSEYHLYPPAAPAVRRARVPDPNGR